MKKIILALLEKYHEIIVNNWVEKLYNSFGNKLSKAQIKTFVGNTLFTLKEIINSSDYISADQYLLDSYNLFANNKLNLLEISQIFSDGRHTILNLLESDNSYDFEPLIILGFIDEVFEQIYARYGMLYQEAQMKELKKDRDRLAKKLEMNQQYLQNILHSSDSAIMVVDNNEEFIAWNKGAENIFGYTQEEMIGQSSSKLLPEGENYIDELESIINDIETKGTIKILETERKTKDGRIIPVQLNVTKLPSKNNKYTGRTVVITDVTEVKRLQQQVDQSEKLAVIGQLAAGVAHEIGNPLASISSLVQILQRKSQDKFFRDQLLNIKDNIDRISKIVRELVDLSRPPSHEELITQITEVIKTAIGIVKYDKRVKKVEFITELDPNLPMVKIVPDQLLQVFINILINSLDAVEGEGIINVKSYHDNDNIYVEIVDNGCGISQEHLGKIFDPFYTTKQVGKGTGLGLSVSYGIIKKFNGDIYVASEENNGSNFKVKIPINKNMF